MMAAIFAAKSGAQVALLEKNDVVGRKILATGNGRCNITNQDIDISRYHGADTYFAAPILAAFDQFETMVFFETLGVQLKEEDRGRMFPMTDQAKTVVDALKKELRKLEVNILTRFTVKKVFSYSQEYKNTLGWEITSETGQKITADKLILTTGGKAAYALGSSGDGLFWAKNLGHTIVPIHAALVPIETKETFVKEIMGIKLPVKTVLIVDGKIAETRQGDILFTHFGVSGPAAMGLAGRGSQALADGKEATITIDILPNISAIELDAKIAKLFERNGKKAVKTIIADTIPQKLAPQILALAGIKESTKAAEISKSQRHNIIQALKDFRLTVSKVRPLKEAQVTAGGIATAEIDENLQSKIVPNLYFAGEILDIDGDSGGFNLQWAWSSGKIAGEAAARRING